MNDFSDVRLVYFFFFLFTFKLKGCIKFLVIDKIVEIEMRNMKEKKK